MYSTVDRYGAWARGAFRGWASALCAPPGSATLQLSKLFRQANPADGQVISSPENSTRDERFKGWIERLLVGHFRSYGSCTGRLSKNRFRAKREQIEKCEERLPESESQNLALTVLYAPDSLDGGSLTAHCPP